MNNEKAKHLALSIFTFLFLNICEAQKLKEVSVNYNMRDGLPSNEVYHVIQDQSGYMWFATDRGVSRYDGNKFTNYTVGTGLVSNVVFKFYQDRYDRIWCLGGEKKLCYIKDGIFHKYEYNQLLQDSLGPSREIQIHIDSSTSLHVFGKHGYAKISSKGEFFWIYRRVYAPGDLRKFDLSIRLFETEAYSYLSDEVDGSNIITHYSNGNSSTTAGIENIGAPKYSIHRNGKTYTLDSKDLIISDSEGYQTVSYKGRLTYIERTPGGIFLGIFKGGGAWIDELGEVKSRILANSSVTSIFYDSSQGVWVSTLDDGVFYYPYYGKQFKEASTSECNSITWVENQIFCGYRDGLIKTLKDRNLSLTRDLKEIPGFNVLNGMQYDAQNQELYFLANPFSREIDVDIISDNMVWKRGLSFHNDTLFAIGYTSIMLYHKNKLVKLIDSKDHNFRAHVRFGERDYITSMQGLYVLDGEKVKRASVNPKLNYPLNEIEVFDNYLVIGTAGFGIIIYNPENDSAIQITTDEGLLDNFVSSIKVNGNEIWVGTSNGVSQVKPEEAGFLVGRKYTTLSSVNDILITNDTVWLATDDGMQMVYFDNFAEPKVSTNIEVVYVNGTVLNPEHYSELNYNENNIRVDFAGIDYNNLGKSTYRYALSSDESDIQWSYTTLNSIEFSNLVPGAYIFNVATMNTEGVWGLTSTISFIISPSFWRTNTFYLGLLISVSLLLWAWYRIQTARIKRDTKIAQLQLSALRAQMNPHFIFNAFNSIRGFMVKGRIEQADEFLVKFARVVREFLNHSSKDTILLDEEVKLLRDYLDLEQLRSDDGFDYEINLEEELEPEIMSVPSMVVQPFVENAIIHGVLKLEKSRGKLNVDFTLSDDRLNIICVITDNGVGQFSTSDIRAGHALEITNRRLNLIGSDSAFKIEDLGKLNPGETGTRVELNLKIY